MFLRLNRLFIPEVKALHDAIEANKAAAARCKEKVAQVEGAMANTACRSYDYDSIAVSYTWELASVSMRYSQGDGVHTSLS